MNFLSLRRSAVVALLACGWPLAQVACGGDERATGAVANSSAAVGPTSGAGAGEAGGAGPGGGPGSGGTSTTTTSGQGGEGGQGGGASELEVLLEQLRNDLDGTLLAQSAAEGWPVPLDEGGRLFVSTDPAFTNLAGDHNGWVADPMTPDQGFWWTVADPTPGSGYKLDSGNGDVADPWSRSYNYDSFGRISLVAPTAAHLDRFFAVGDANVAPRTVRVWVPAQAPTHLLYAHDGQNLFDPEAVWGGWQLATSLPPAMLVVAIDNTPARMDEYTHVGDDLGGGPIGGEGDAYADFVQTTVRGLVAQHYGEPAKIGVMGSSLGGLISLHIADRHDGAYDFVASLSGTVGWGSMGDGVTNETIIERYAAGGHQGTAIYIDSGGGGTCLDSDGDGIQDDGNDSDNYCVNKQLEATLVAAGYVYDTDLWHWHEPGAPHNEAAWGARVFRPLEIFAGL